MIDLTTARPGDKFRRRDGEIVEYSKKFYNNKYPHRMSNNDIYTDNGVFCIAENPSKYDLIEKIKEEEEMKETKEFNNGDYFTVEINDKKYNVKPFTILDIYKKDPCKGEFTKLLEELDGWNVDEIIEYEAEFLDFRTLCDNIPWLIEKGFMEETITETPLEPGMILIGDNDKHEFLICEDNRFVVIKNEHNPKNVGSFSDRTYKSLEEFNFVYFGYKIKK